MKNRCALSSRRGTRLRSTRYLQYNKAKADCFVGYQAAAASKQREIDALNQQVLELSSQVEVMREALESCAARTFINDPLMAEIHSALFITPSASLQAHDNEVAAKALEDAKEEFYGYKNHTSDEMFVDTAIQLLDDLAAAKRKGE